MKVIQVVKKAFSSQLSSFAVGAHNRMFVFVALHVYLRREHGLLALHRAHVVLEVVVRMQHRARMRSHSQRARVVDEPVGQARAALPFSLPGSGVLKPHLQVN